MSRPPEKTGTSGRRISFAARFAGMAGKMKDAKGRKTPKAEALSDWGFGNVAAARKFANSHKNHRSKTMPKVGNKEFDYSPQGVAAARKEAHVPANQYKKLRKERWVRASLE